ncbi:methyltransferase [Novosphingobium fuchskuhlense]|uniref:Methyltransferase n=1 Tax=Novosphingobium fuchskuhlense TaxID=1117702 RepID=A0A117UUD9_9SPHN|nr:methyltransferase domain-containing protein [Novosphingobium fuchskuhlense]KUR71034.1 methyltransferase [Novosphingobium fuchskuhlense]
MASPPPPTIFAPARRRAMRARMRLLERRADAPRFLAEDMVDDLLDRLSFLRHQPRRALVVGDTTGLLAAALAAQGCAVVRADPAPIAGELPIDEEQPISEPGFDLVAALGTLATVNDLPGAMLHIRRALAPGGLAVLSFCGAGSVPALRQIMAETDGDRPAARIHPQVDVRAGGDLLQRCGFADPMSDSRTLDVRYRSLGRLVADLRAQGLGNCLARPGPALGKAGATRAHAAFAAMADAEGRVSERFAILTLSGWNKALRPPKF